MWGENQIDYTKEELLTIWTNEGLNNVKIKEAVDPPFTKEMLIECQSLEELEAYFKKGSWFLGQGFYYQTLCFINTIDCGDEWLAIKWEVPFETITFSGIIKSGGFKRYLERLLNATKEELLWGNY